MSQKVSSNNISKLFQYAFNKTIIDDHNQFLKSLYNQYGEEFGFTYIDLYNRYYINKIHLVPTKSKQKYTKPKLPPDINRCVARCWGGKNHVIYNSNNNTWSYGYRCKKNKTKSTDYCGIHLNEINKGYLTHGKWDGPVPHQHYNKYKFKIESNMSKC